MYKLTPAARRALAAYTAADDRTRKVLAKPGLAPDGKPLPVYAKRGYKPAVSAALVAWRGVFGYLETPLAGNSALNAAAHNAAAVAYADVQLLALRATLRNPKLTHVQRRDRPLEGRPPFEAAADLEVQGVLIALIALDPASPAFTKLTAQWRKAGLPL